MLLGRLELFTVLVLLTPSGGLKQRADRGGANLVVHLGLELRKLASNRPRMSRAARRRPRRPSGGARVQHLSRHAGAIPAPARRSWDQAEGDCQLASSAALSRARVCLMLMRLPTPYGPPVQPVLTSQQREPWRRIFALSRSAYTAGW